MPRRRVVRGDDPHVIDVLAPAETGPVELDDPAMFDPPADDPLAADPPLVPSPVARPVPEHQLTDDQRRIRLLEDRLAQELGARDVEPQPDSAVTPGARDNIVIHFVADGLTALGAVWYRGQELEFTPGSAAYAGTVDRTGKSWLDLRDDENAQVQRWGKVMFRPGPWPGKALTAAAATAWENLKPLREGQKLTPTEAELAAVARAEARRGRAAPRLPTR